MKLLSFRPFCTGYFPDDSAMEGGFTDSHGHALGTLQGFLAGDDPHVSVAMQADILPWGTYLSLPEFDWKYGKTVIFRLCDTGGAFKGTGLTRMDICTAGKYESMDNFLNANHWAVAMIYGQVK